MRVKYVGDGIQPLVGTTVVRSKSYSLVRNMDKLKELVDAGYEFVIKEDGEEIPAEEYFAKQEKVEVKSEIEVVEEDTEKETEDIGEQEVLDYKSLFEGHWTKQVSNVKEYDNKEQVKSILRYAKDNEVTDGVIKRIEEYLDSL